MTGSSAIGAACLALALLPSGTDAAPKPWKPDVAAAERYMRSRPGTATFSLRVGDRVYGHHARRAVPAMSLMKPILMAAYLRRSEVRRRPLTRADRRLLGPMIRRSDNEAANRALAVVGLAGELAVARLAGMRDFVPFSEWGTSETSARDQSLLFWRIRRILPRRHRAYGLTLLRTIVRDQRWGIAEVRPRGWRLYFKGGWGSASGAASHQAALLVKGRRRVALAVTTEGSGSHAASTATLRGVARRLLRGLARSRR